MKFLQSNEVLQIGVFHDLLDGFFVGKSTLFFNDEGTQRDTERFRYISSMLWEMRSISIFNNVLGNQIGHLDPAVISIEFATCKKSEVFE